MQKKSGLSGVLNVKGFTLIELLVVVLIIGILAAVAMPQYQKAVNKSRATQAVTVLKSLVDAQEVFFLTNNAYTNDISLLDVDIPEELIFDAAPDDTKPNQYQFRCKEKRTCQAKASSTNLPHFEYHMTHVQSQDIYVGKFWCWVSADKTDLAKNICKSLGRPDTEVGDNYYLLN